jgi:hypothetical protein
VFDICSHVACGGIGAIPASTLNSSTTGRGEASAWSHAAPTPSGSSQKTPASPASSP